MAYKTFANGFPLPASDLNNYLMNQSVIVFADAAARTAAIASPTEGMVTYLEDTNTVEVYDGSAWTDINDNTAAIPKSTVTTAGDLIIADGASSVTRLAIGADGTILTSNGTTASWATNTALEASIFDAEGDIIYATGADTAARLPRGTDGQVLTATSTSIGWETLTAGGMTLIGSTTLSGSSVTIGSIPATYKDLRIVVRDFQPSTNGRALRLQLNGVTGSNYNNVSDNTSSRAFAETYFTADLDHNSTGDGLTVFDIPDYANTSTWKSIDMFEIVKNASTPANAGIAKRYGAFNQTGAISSVTLLSSVTLNGGTALVYGVA